MNKNLSVTAKKQQKLMYTIAARMSERVKKGLHSEERAMTNKWTFRTTNILKKNVCRTEKGVFFVQKHVLFFIIETKVK
jgi:hypothetical protein